MLKSEYNRLINYINQDYDYIKNIKIDGFYMVLDISKNICFIYDVQNNCVIDEEEEIFYCKNKDEKGFDVNNKHYSFVDFVDYKYYQFQNW